LKQEGKHFSDEAQRNPGNEGEGNYSLVAY